MAEVQDRAWNRPFTLVELLVVVAVVAILASMLLPALNLARDRARMSRCAGNLRQCFVGAAGFEGDRDAMLPAWYYPMHPKGVVPADVVGIGSKFGWSFNVAAVALIDDAYVPASDRVYNATWSQLGSAAAQSVFGCPAGFTPTGTNNDTLGEMNDEQRRRAMLKVSVFVADTTVPCGECDQHGRQIDTRFSLMTGYGINMNAGSFGWYHNATVNRGFYKRRAWASPPDRVGYIFESNVSVIDENHTETLYSLTRNSWGTGGVTYGPTARHLGLTSTNFVYGDGHLGRLRDLYNTRNDFPFVWY